ncbi:MbcA/ParS/Xre antitoxin family protein [Deinococcus metallilatus]|uniref:Uncharacterized protein (DUF2384 family) n=1 Tax=Deinococcus metallilatus TaxID=1211322 RepID=A0ABR6MYC3_9DEIO|nr:MbcA/ParS/Xre antitoxin family protein [Deinococcus metallilatus]MBB5296918.1 uncharacterized protein (DUF2384 family) [Deinococcus metallilatus]GMA15186.1 hypothetical protein GCM10025871_15170 [Deinococcus metallilatus]
MTQARLKPDLDADQVFAGLRRSSPRQARQQLFEQVTHLDPYRLDALLLQDAPVPPRTSSRLIALNLAALLDVNLKDVMPVLGVSESTLTRQPVPSRLLIDRAYSVVRIFAQVMAVLGPEGAQHWLRTPNPALEGEAPFTLLSTRYGEEKVQNVITALLQGAVL